MCKKIQQFMPLNHMSIPSFICLRVSHPSGILPYIDPLSPNIHNAISPNWSLYISIKNVLREFDKRLRHFLLGDHFINSHNIISWQCMDIIRRKLMLVTIFWCLTLWVVKTIIMNHCIFTECFFYYYYWHKSSRQSYYIWYNLPYNKYPQ